MHVVLVIRDCDGPTIETFNKGTNENFFACNVFCCPVNTAKNYWVDFVGSLRTWFDSKTEKINFMNNKDIKWWTKIEKFGLFLPLSLVKLYHENENKYSQHRYELERFYQRLNNEFKFLEKTSNKNATVDLVQKKLELFPYGHLFEEYNKLKQNSDTTKNENKNERIALNILKKVATKEICQLLRIFTIYCLPPPSSYESSAASWIHSEYLYVLDDMLNVRNTNVLYDIRLKIKQLTKDMASTVDEEQQLNLKKEKDLEFNKLKNTEITGYDFLHNIQSLLNLYMEYKHNIPLRACNISVPIGNGVRMLIECVQEFSHRLFLQGMIHIRIYSFLCLFLVSFYCLLLF